MYNCKFGTASCIHSPPDPTPTTTITTTENFNLFESLESVYPLLELVLDCLNSNDLKLVSSVKQSWHDTAQIILNKRHLLSWYTIGRKFRSKITIINTNDSFNYNNAQFGIIIFNFKRISYNDYFCVHDANNLTQTRTLCFKYFNERLFPHNTEYCALGTTKMDSVFPKASTFAVPEKLACKYFDCCFIPPIPNVKIHKFECNSRTAKKIQLSSSGKLKCLLIFSKTSMTFERNSLLEQLIPESDIGNVALGGGVIKRALSYDAESKKKIEHKKFCLAFTHNDEAESDFDAASIVMDVGQTEEEFRNDLIKFKGKILLRENGLAFRIFCNERRTPYKESAIFSEVFPNIIQIGFGVDGEIGWNKFNLEEGLSKKSRADFNNTNHEWCTIVVFLTWGKLAKQQ